MNRHTSRRIIVIGLSAVLIQAASVAGQTSTTAGPKKSNEAVDASKKSSGEKTNEAVAQGKKLMSDLDVKIKELETQVSRDVSAAGADAKRQVNELKELKSAQARAAKTLDEMSRASAESRDGMTHAFTRSYKDLQQAYEDAVAKLRK